MEFLSHFPRSLLPSQGSWVGVFYSHWFPGKSWRRPQEFLRPGWVCFGYSQDGENSLEGAGKELPFPMFYFFNPLCWSRWEFPHGSLGIWELKTGEGLLWPWGRGIAKIGNLSKECGVLFQKMWDFIPQNVGFYPRTPGPGPGDGKSLLGDGNKKMGVERKREGKRRKREGEREKGKWEKKKRN